MRKLNVLVYDSISVELLNILKTMFEVEVIKYKEISSKLNTIDLVILNGEEKGDLNPDYYGELVNPNTNLVERGWRKYDRLYYVTVGYNVPYLGINDGAHFLTAMAGGSLIQHVEGHKLSHSIEVQGYGTMTAPSDHHQMMYPYQLPKDKYKLLAWSLRFNSHTYLNGRSEEINLPKDFLEPEIVSYKNRRGRFLCFQGDPVKGNKQYIDLFKDLTINLLNNRL